MLKHALVVGLQFAVQGNSCISDKSAIFFFVSGMHACNMHRLGSTLQRPTDEQCGGLS